eukprot:221642-Hanusia_phi.AAC.1
MRRATWRLDEAREARMTETNMAAFSETCTTILNISSFMCHVTHAAAERRRSSIDPPIVVAQEVDLLAG